MGWWYIPYLVPLAKSTTTALDAAPWSPFTVYITLPATRKFSRAELTSHFVSVSYDGDTSLRGSGRSAAMSMAGCASARPSASAGVPSRSHGSSSVPAKAMHLTGSGHPSRKLSSNLMMCNGGANQAETRDWKRGGGGCIRIRPVAREQGKPPPCTHHHPHKLLELVLPCAASCLRRRHMLLGLEGGRRCRPFSLQQ